MDKFMVLDLFSGMGGLSKGFSSKGFEVTGVDRDPRIGIVYKAFNSSSFLVRDLFSETVLGDFDVVVGGPPCRPWSAVNRSKRRGAAHRDFALLGRFFNHILAIRPPVFVLENVPLIRHDPEFNAQIDRARINGYSVSHRIFRYSDFGAATSRRRLIAIGVLNGNSEDLFQSLEGRMRKSMTVSEAIYEFRKRERNEIPDHVWPELKTIEKYRDKYRSGRFGWWTLDWDEPAPSFGNVMKTYILHPDHGVDSGDPRTVSVLEVSRIMGFNHGFTFPSGLGMGLRYQMLVDSVSPVFSEALADAISKWL
ncbi:DNA cytosine methyltransferase [Cuniculiplasma sp. SKW4]|uniref:DNA cytosine methyltransferase n=1 Tax=Cuniculiplasma sp. SKW4 TaxID=3400171 RepID=UPI003FD646C0